MNNMKLFTGLFFFLGLLLNDNNVYAQPTLRPPLLGIAYVEVQCADAKASKVFYETVLGYSVAPHVLPAGKKSGGFLMEVNARQSIIVRDGLPKDQDERLLSLAFETTDAEAMRVYLQSKKIAVPSAVQRESNGDRWFMVHDPDNHEIRFLQYGRQHPPGADKNISKRILHAGLSIASAAKADQFYKDVLGFTETWRGGASDSVTSWINMHVPESTDYLEYMLTTGPVNRQQLGSMHHIALLVPDMQAALDQLHINTASNHYTIAQPRIGRNNRWQLNLFDPDGTRIELMEPFTMR